MTAAKLTHGKQLVKALTETLPPNLKFTTEETITRSVTSSTPATGWRCCGHGSPSRRATAT